MPEYHTQEVVTAKLSPTEYLSLMEKLQAAHRLKYGAYSSNDKMHNLRIVLVDEVNELMQKALAYGLAKRGY